MAVGQAHFTIDALDTEGHSYQAWLIHRVCKSAAWFHVVARGIKRRVMFQQDRDREHFLELLGAVIEGFRSTAIAPTRRSRGKSLRTKTGL